MNSEERENQTTWQSIACVNKWPDPILLKNVAKLRGFPLSNGGFRNRCTGRDADPLLSKNLFSTGRYTALRLNILVKWLDDRTKNRN